MTYTIVYIDEECDAHDNFADFVEAKDTERRFKVISLFPERSLDEMLASIKQENADALVSDFRLNEHIKELGYNVPYDGVELVDAFISIRQNHPSFVITSFPADAAHQSVDVNFIYVKSVLNQSDSADLDFLERIRIQIDHYRKKVSDAEMRVLQLLSKKESDSLTIREEEELIALDTFLECSIDKGSAIPNELKKPTNESRLSELILKVDQLIEKIDNEN